MRDDSFYERTFHFKFLSMFSKLNAKSILILLSSYIFLQLFWWAYIILDLQSLVLQADQLTTKRWMILSEGSVYVTLLCFGFYTLNKSIKKELELSRQQQNFLLSVTHEIKTPITALKLSLQTLKKSKSSEEITSQILDHALKEQKRLEQFVDDIFAVNALEDSRWEKSESDVHLHTLISNISETLQSVYPANHIHVSCPEIELKTDDKALKIVLSNLIENACKYSPFCGHVNVNAEILDKNIFIHIIDEGEGIDPKDQKNIFKKFYRLGEEEKRRNKGSGLGLYLVKSFTQYLNGSVSVKSNRPKGSIFTVQLPL
jgi:signal transduction histidine kinase